MTRSGGRQASPGRGTNIPRVGDWNQRVVVDWVRRHPEGTSRVDLAAATGLSSQTISNVTRRLLSRGLIEERGQVGHGPGKPRTLLGLVPGGLHAIGIHLDPLVTSVALLDLTGTVVARTERRTPRGGPGRAIRAMAEAAKGLVEESGTDPATIAGAGVAVPGPIEVSTGTVVDPPLLDGWHRVALRDRLAELLGTSVLVDKDVIAAAVAEDWVRTEDDERTFVFWYLGSGMGAGLVHRGQVLRGSSNNVGEVPSLVVDTTDPGASTKSSSAWAPEHLARQGVACGALPGSALPDAPPGGEAPDRRTTDAAVSELCRRSEAGDPRAAEVLDRHALLVARSVVVVCDLIDAEEVVFGGPYWSRLRHRLQPVVSAELQAHAAVRDVHPVRVGGTRFGPDVGAVGAASLVLDDALALRPSSLLLQV